jgi:RNA:NAD 2'-phosphotransferase (TPT1/KptA family)
MGASVREITYAAIDQLIAQHPHRNEVGRLLVATVVDLNDVNRTSMFGRQMTEYASARLTQLDYDVIHATVRQDHMLVRQDGLFLLSRDIRNLVADYNAKSVVVGTYGLVNDFVFVSLKLVSTVDDSTLAAVDFTIKREGPVVEMLSAPGAMR